MDFNKYIQVRKAENGVKALIEKKSFWQRLKDMAKFDAKNTIDLLGGKKSVLQAISDRNKFTHQDLLNNNQAYRDAYSTVQGIEDAVKDKINKKITSNEVLTRLKENIKEGISDTAQSNELHHKYDVSEKGISKKQPFWKRLRNVLTGKKSMYAEVRDNSAAVRDIDAKIYGTYSGIRKTLYQLRVSKPGQFSEMKNPTMQHENPNQTRIIAMHGKGEVTNNAQMLQEKQVQTNSDAYNALETYARISAMEQMSGISGFSFNGKNKDGCLDTLKQMPKDVINYTLSNLKANTENTSIGNADFNAKVVAIADKLPEQLGKDEQYGLAMKNAMSPAAHSLQDVFNNVRQYKDANAYDSSKSGQAIYEHKNKDFISDMQKIVDIYKENPNDAAVCGLLKDNLSLLSQAAVSAASHQEVDKMSELMFQLGKELQTNSSVSSENKAKVYEGLANMTNYEGENGRHYNAFTNSSMYKNSLYELMEKADTKDKDMFYGKLTDKKLFEYSINYEKAPERIQPQKQISVSLMKGLQQEVYN